MEDYLDIINQQESQEAIQFLKELFGKKMANNKQQQEQEEPCELLGVADIATKCGHYVEYPLSSKLGTYVAQHYSKKDKIKKELRNIKSVRLITAVNLYPSNDEEVQDLIETFFGELQS